MYQSHSTSDYAKDVLRLNFQLLDDTAFEPYAATEFSAGFDLSLPKDFIFRRRSITVVDYKIAFETPDTHFARLETRSSLAKIGLMHLGGIIDSDYRGTIKGIIYNLSDDNIILKRGRRLTQLVFIPVYHPVLVSASTLNQTGRGLSGFGSSGPSHFSVDINADEPIDWE